MTVRVSDMEARARRAQKLLERGREVDLSDDDFCRRLMAHCDGIEQALLEEEPPPFDAQAIADAPHDSLVRAVYENQQGHPKKQPAAADTDAGPSAAAGGEEVAGGEAAFDQVFREFQESGPWPLPELAPMAIDEEEHAQLLEYATLTSPQQLALLFLEEWLPIELTRLAGVFSPAHLFVLTLRELCRAELTLLCQSRDADVSFEASCRLFRYEERLRARFQQHPRRGECAIDEKHPYQRCDPAQYAKLTDDERRKLAPKSKAARRDFVRAALVRNKVIEKNAPDLIEACLRRAAWWLGMAMDARTPLALFAKLSREANLFDRLSPAPPIPTTNNPQLPRAMRLPMALSLAGAFHQVRHEQSDAGRLRWASHLYRVLLARTHGVEAAAAFTPLMGAQRWPGMPDAEEGETPEIASDAAGESGEAAAGARAPP